MPVTEIRGAQIKDVDITVSDIADGAVTLAKQANLPANTIIGNDSGSPATPQALTVAEVIAMGIGGGSGGHIIEDNSTPMTARAALNFIGDGVTATDNAGDDSTDVTIPAGFGYPDLALGEDELTNGDFATDASDWVLGAGWAWTGAGQVTHTPGNTAALYQSGTLEQGLSYHVQVWHNLGTSGTLKIFFDDGAYWELDVDESLDDIGVWWEAEGIKIKLVPSSDYDGVVTFVAVYRQPYIQDAKADGTTQGRKDGAWVEITGGSAHIIQEEGTPLTARANLNFIGDGVTAVDNSGDDSTDVTIPVGDTPEDAIMYGRKSAAWEPLQMSDVGGQTEGVDIIINGGFDADTDWTKGAGWTITGGKAVGTAASTRLQAIVPPLIINHWYAVGFDLTVTSGTISTQDAQVFPSSDTLYVIYKASETGFYITGVDFTGTIDNVTATDLGLSTVLSSMVDKLNNQDVFGIKSFYEFPLTPQQAPAADYEVANKKYVDDNTLDIAGKKPYHGIEAAGALSFNAGSHVLTIASGTNTYWYFGVEYTTASAIVCDIDDFESLTTNTLYYFYFDNPIGTLTCSANPLLWDLNTIVPVATVFWNGAAGAISTELHKHDRDLRWHIWAHDTIGTRYESGLGKTKPTTADDATLQIEEGYIHDEDLDLHITQQTTMRGWHKASASVYTFADYSLPYCGAGAQPQYLRTSDYSLQDVGASDYACMWVYATTDNSRPIYIIPTHAAAAHNTIALARAETQPVITALNLAPEWKLIYKFIYKGNGDFEESVDYRTVSSLPGGGAVTVAASAVSVVPTGSIAATNVQTALAELDTEKVPLASTLTGTAPITIAGDNAEHDLSASRTIAIPAATAAVNGYATSVQITKLDGIAAGSQVNVLEGVTGTSPIVAGAVTAKSQAISLVNDAAATITQIDTANPVSALDTDIPTSKAVGASLATHAALKTGVHGKNVSYQIISQGAPDTESTGAITIHIADMLKGIVTGNPSAARAYTLDTGTNCDGGMTISADEAFDWVLINLATTATYIITLTAAAGHTIVGNPLIAAQSGTTGGLWGTASAMFRTRKTAANTFITYRIA